MMNRKVGLYAVIGGVVGAVLTMAVGSVLPLGAQSQSDNFGEITCTGLKVVNPDGKALIKLSAENMGGFVQIWSKKYSPGGVVFLGASKYGGHVMCQSTASNARRRGEITMGFSAQSPDGNVEIDVDGYPLKALK